MKKRIVSLAITLIMAIASFNVLLVGCGSKTNNVYTLSFSGINCESIEDIKVKEGDLVPLPTNVPSRTGYKLVYWTYNGQRFNEKTPITKDMELVAYWGEIVKYYVKHYKKNIYNDNYCLIKTETKYGAIGDKTNATTTSITNYKLSSTLTQVEILGAGQEVGLYYIPSKNTTISIANSKTKTFLGKSTVSEFCDYSSSLTSSTLYDYQENTEFSWNSEGADKTYNVYLSTKSDYSDSMMFTTKENKIIFGVLVPSTKYYIKITCEDKILEEGSFETANDGVRFINIPNMCNVRDLGGWKINSTSRVAYSKIYRGAELNGIKGVSKITEEGINIFKNILKIKTELDLRDYKKEITNDQINSENVAGVNKYVNQYIACYSWLVPENAVDKIDNDDYTSGTVAGLKNIFKLLADESNYPIYFHCVWGADRTGTLAFIINGLLGVSYLDLIKDFCLTSFSGAIRYCYTPNKSYDKVTLAEAKTYSSIYKFYWQIMTYYHTAENTLASSLENYLVNGIGVLQTDINAMKNIMTEKTSK